MLILGIDTSTEIGAVGLIEGETFLGEINIRLHHRHSKRLLPNIDYLFQESGREVRDLDGLAVTIGPGSFTGLRIGLSTVKTFAQFLDIPVIGLSTLEVLAYNIWQFKGWLVPVLDARRKRVYTSLYRGGEKDIKSSRKWEDQALSLRKLLDKLNHYDCDGDFYLVGNAIKTYYKIFKETDINISFSSPALNLPRGSAVAELGRFYLEKGRSDNPEELLPNYLKKPQAEINRLKKIKSGE